MRIGREEILPGTRQLLELPLGMLPTLTPISMRVEVIRGERSGPIVFIGGTVHGDEIIGIDVVQNVLDAFTPQTLCGTLIGIPVVNVFGFLENSRYLPDRRDLNRSFPGSEKGSLAARTAHFYFTEIVEKCTHGIDLHSAAKGRYNHPHIRADFSFTELKSLAQAFGAPLMLDSKGPQRSLRRVATDSGVPTLLFEGGEASRLDRSVIGVATRGCLRVLHALGMSTQAPQVRQESVLCESSYWIRAKRSGLVRLSVRPGEYVEKGDILGTLGDAFQDDIIDIRASSAGYVLSVVTYPIVIQGEALIHVGRC